MKNGYLFVFILSFFFTTNLLAQVTPGKALSLNGTDQCADLNDLPVFSPTTIASKTYEVWINPTSTADGTIVSKYSNMDASNSDFFILLNAGKVQVAGNGTNSFFSASDISAGVWTHIAVVFKNGTDETQIYINGELDAVGTLYYNLDPGWTHLGIGRIAGNDPKHYYSGAIDELRIWDGVRTQSEIKQNMFGAVSGSSTNLIAYYQFETMTNGFLISSTGNTDYNGWYFNSPQLIVSHAHDIPVAISASAIAGTSFTANWTAPSILDADKYYLDVATDAVFTSHVSGYPKDVGTVTTYNLTGLTADTEYFYRVRADRNSISATESYSNTKSVYLPTTMTAPGNAITMNNTGYVNSTNPVTLSELTFEAWIKTASADGWDGIISTDDANNNFAQISIVDNVLMAQVGKDMSSYREVKGSTVLTDNLWHHVAFTLSGNTMKLYLDGIEESYVGGQADGDISGITITDILHIGMDRDLVAIFNGSMDEVRVWNKVLTEAEINSQMYDIIDPATSGLQLYYRTDQSAGSLLDDFTSNNNDGNIINTISWDESYAMVVPATEAASTITETSFTANWNAPAVGSVEKYYLDVSSSSNFNTSLTGYPKDVSTATTYTVTGLSQNTSYYYRVKAEKSSVTGQAIYSDAMEVTTTASMSPPGNALSFSTDSFVDLGDVAIAGNGVRTISLWLKTTTNTGTVCFLSTGTATDDQTFSLRMSNGYLGFMGYLNDYDPASGTILADGKWHHVAITYDGTILKAFVDGGVEWSVNKTLNTIGQNNYLGKSNHAGFESYFTGQLDEVRFWNKELTQSEIQNQMYNVIDPATTGLVAYYKADQSTGTLLHDLTANQNHGDFVNTVTWAESYAMVIPTVAAATSITQTSFAANWNAPANSSADKYYLDVSMVSDFSSSLTGFPKDVGAVNTYSITGLTPGIKYYYRVKSEKSNVGESLFSSSAAVTTLPMLPPGNAISLNNTGYVNSTKQVTLSDLTFEAWIKTSSSDSWDGVISTDDANNNYAQITIVDNVLMGQVEKDMSTTRGVKGTTTITDNFWHHVAFTLSGNTMKLYLDGIEESYVDGQADGDVSGITITDVLHIGVERERNNVFNGSMDEIRIWNKVLTGTEIQNQMYNIIDPATSGLVTYYKADQSTGTLLYDLTANQNHGAFVNTVSWVESYAMVVPTATAASSVTETAFVANWDAPSYGSPEKYFLEVSTSADFGTLLTGYPKDVGAVTSYTVTGLMFDFTHYYRVRAFKSAAGYGVCSNTITQATAEPMDAPGNAISFANNSFVDLGDVAVAGNGARTISLWLKTNTISATQNFLSSGTATNDQAFNLRLGNGYLGFMGYVNDYDPGAGTFLADGKWHYIVAVYDGSTLKTYIDGNVEWSATKTLNTVGQNNYLGKSNHDGAENYFTGQLDEVRFYNRALTFAEVYSGMKGIVNPDNDNNLIGYYKCDQSSGTNLYDLTANQRHASLENSPGWVESYAMVVPTVAQSNSILETGFVANWFAPVSGDVDKYYMEISTSENFGSFVSGYPKDVGNVLSYDATGLTPDTKYYYRVRADKISVTGTGATSNVVSIQTKESMAPPGNALSFDGAQNQFVELGDVSISGNGARTISLWLKAGNTGHTQNFFSSGTPASGQTFNLRINPSGLLGFMGYWADVDPTAGKVITDNIWHHVAFAYTGTQLWAYIDGNLEWYRDLSLNTQGQNNFLGKSNHSGYESYFSGQLDEVRIYNRALSQAEISSTMYNIIDPASAGLIAYYRFDASKGITLLDRTANHYDGILSGSPGWIESFAMIAPNATGATDVQGSSFVANWEAIPNKTCDKYYLSVATDAAFNNLVLNNHDVGNVLSYKVSGLNLNTTYYYLVRGHNNALGTTRISNTPSLQTTGTLNPPGNALALDGYYRYVNFGNIPQFAPTTSSAKTFEMWIKPVAGGDGIILGKYMNFGSSNMFIGVNPAGKIYINGNGTSATVYSNGSIIPNQWNHIAVSMMLGGGNVKIYINGELDTSTQVNFSQDTGSTSFRIGMFDGCTEGQFYEGSIDELRIWEGVRSAEEIKSNMNAIINTSSSGLIAYYNFDYTSGTTLADQTGNINATYYNTERWGWWVDSYVMVLPTATEATNITQESFTANWSAPTIGRADKYFLDVAIDEGFNSLIIDDQEVSSGLSFDVRGIASGTTYYYRVRSAENTPSGVNIGLNSYTISATTLVTTKDIATALGLDPAKIPVSIDNSLSAQIKIPDLLGVFSPTQGNSFVHISTGVAGAGTDGLASPDPGTDLETNRDGGAGIFNDPVALTIGPIPVPAGQNSISIDMNLLTTETRASNNDWLMVVLESAQNPNNQQQLALLKVNDIGYAFGTNSILGTGFENVGKATGNMTAKAPTTPGDSVTIKVYLDDLNDHLYDTAVLLDHIRFSSSTIAQTGVQKEIKLNPANIELLDSESANITVSITQAAPTGGLTVSLQSGNNGIVTLSQTSVTIPENALSATGTIVCNSAGASGVTTISAVATGYPTTTTNVRVGPDLYINPEDIIKTEESGVRKVHVTYHNSGAEVGRATLRIIETDRQNIVVSRTKYSTTTNVSSIPANGQGTYTFNYTPYSMQTTITATIDSDTQIPERNETNNTAVKEFDFDKEKPVVERVWAQYDGNSDPNIIGRFMSNKGLWALGNSTINNTFYANVPGSFIDKVVFKFKGNDGKIYIEEDADFTDGFWAIIFNVAQLPPGISTLTVTAYNIYGDASNHVTKQIRNDEWPDWVKTVLIFDSQIHYSPDGKNLICRLKPKARDALSWLFGMNGSPLGNGTYIGGKGVFEYNINVPLNSEHNLQGEIIAKYYLFALGRTRIIEGRGTLYFNSDMSLNLIKLYFGYDGPIASIGWIERNHLGLGWPFNDMYYAVGGNIYLKSDSKIQIVMKIDGATGELTFPRADDGAVTYIEPGFGINLGLYAGVIWGPHWIGLRLDGSANIYARAAFVTGENPSFNVHGNVGMSLSARLFGFINIYVPIGPWNLFGEAQPSQLYKNIQVEQSTQSIPNILPLPSVAADSSGNVMVAWLENSNDPNGVSNIYYSTKTSGGSFIAPELMVDNQYMKTEPKITYLPDGNANAVWVQNSKLNSYYGAQPDISEVMKYQDVYYSAWDQTNWSAPTLVTSETVGNEKDDGMPVIAVANDGSEKLILWTRNIADNPSDQLKNEIFYSKVIGDDIGSMQSLTNNNESDFMVEGAYFSDTSAVALWANDVDGDSRTINDNQLFYSLWKDQTWTTPASITNNFSQKKELSIASLQNGKALAAWVEMVELTDSSHEYSLVAAAYDAGTNSWSNSEVILTSVNHILEPTVQVDKRNIATITFRGPTEDRTGDVMITAKNFNLAGSSWKTPVTIGEDNLTDWMIATTIDANNNQYFVNLKSIHPDSLAANPAARSSVSNFHGGLSLSTKSISQTGEVGGSLNLGSYSLTPDLVVATSDIIVNENELRTGVSSQVQVSVTNVGAAASTPTTVKVYKNYTAPGGGTLIQTLNLPALVPDEIDTLSFSYTFETTNEFKVDVDPDNSVGEQDEGNNIATKTITLLPDPEAASLSTSFVGGIKVGETGTISANIRNIGRTSANNFIVKFYTNNVDDIATSAIIEEKAVGYINFDDSTTVESSYTIASAGMKYFWIEIDPDNSLTELSETNNIASTSITVLPDIAIGAMWYDSDLGENKLYAELSNSGGANAGAFKTYLYSGDPLNDGVLKDSISAASLNMGITDTVVIGYVTRAGVELLYLWVDKDDLMDELSTSNNMKYLSVLRTGSVDVTPEIVLENSSYPIGMAYPLNIKVKNIGSSGCASVGYKLYDDTGALVAENTVSSVDALDEIIDVVYVTFDRDNIEYTLVLDEDNTLIESDKTNNETSKTILGFEVARENMQLHTGWNMVSSNIEPLEDDIRQMMSGTQSSLVLMKDGFGNVYWPSSNINTLRRWRIEKGYNIYMSQPGSIEMLGEELNPRYRSIVVMNGWNLISYLRNSSLDIETCLASIEDNLVIVKNGLGEIYWPDYGINTIGEMNPGEGYQIYVDRTVVFSYPENDNVENMLKEDSNQYIDNKLEKKYPVHYAVKGVSTGSNSTYLLNIDKSFLDDEIGVFNSRGEIVASGRIENNKAAITVWGDNEMTPDTVDGALEDETLYFVYWHKESGREIPVKIMSVSSAFTDAELDTIPVYQNDGLFKISAEVEDLIPTEFLLSQNYPNPFNPRTKIRYAIPNDGHVKIDVIDILGQQVEVLVDQAKPAGYYEINFENRSLASGVYFYRVIYEQSTLVKKMILLK